MRGKNKFVIFVALFLLPIYIAESAWAAPAFPQFGQVVSSFLPKVNSTSSADSLLLADEYLKNPPQLSAEMGERVEIYSGTSPYRIFVIQDAHALPEAQKSAANILGVWVKQMGLDFIGLEGAEGELPHSLLGSFPNRSARKILAEELLQEAIIGGAEYLQMTRYPSLHLYGIENKKLYNLNREAFLNLLGLRSQAQALLKRMLGHAMEEASQVLPVDYLRLRESSRAAYEKGDWKNHLEVLSSMRKNVRGEYPSFDFWMKANALSKSIDFSRVQKEIRSFQQNGKLGAYFIEQVRRLIEGREPENNLRLEVALWKQSPEWLKRYPQATAALKAAYLMRRAGHGLFEDSEKMEDDLAATLCPSEKQTRVVRKLQNLDIVASLISMSLNSHDYEKLRVRRDEISAADLSDSNAVGFRAEELHLLEEALRAGESFYRIAIRRDAALAEKLIHEMTVRRLKSGALVIGGFHTAGLLEVLRQHKISYEVVRPKIQSEISPQHQALYEKRMKNQGSKLEILKDNGSEIRTYKKSDAALHLQTPRRTDIAFTNRLYPVLEGLGSVLGGRPMVTADQLLSAAATRPQHEVMYLRTLSQQNVGGQLWVSPDGQTTAFVLPAKASRNSLVLAQGPGAKTISGKGAVAIESEGREIWIGRSEFRADLLHGKFQQVSPKRSEVRTDDSLAWVSVRPPFHDLIEFENFKRALEVRIEAFANISKIAGDGSTKRFEAGGMILDYTVTNGRAQITNFQTHWENLESPNMRAAMLSFWEEFFAGVVLYSSNKVQFASMVERLSIRVLSRWHEQGLLQEALANQTGEGEDFFQKIVLHMAKPTPQKMTDEAVYESLMEKIHSGNAKIPLPGSFKVWQNWQKQTGDAAEQNLNDILNETATGASAHLQQLVNQDIPEFLLRHARLKIVSGLGFDPNFTDGLQGQSLEWAKALSTLDPNFQMPDDSLLHLVVETVHVLAEPEQTSVPLLPSVKLSSVDWFEGMPALEQLQQFGFDQLKSFLEVLEQRKAAHPAEFLRDSEIVLPFWEALVQVIQVEAEEAQLKLQSPPALQQPADSRDHLLQRDRQPEVVAKSYKWAPWIIDTLLLAAGVFLRDTASWVSIGGTFLAYRSGWMIGMLLNEWGHLFAALSIGKWRTALSIKNMMAHLSLGEFVFSFVPFKALKAGFVELNEKETGAINFIRWTGWLFGFGAFLVLANMAFSIVIPVWLIYTSIGAALMAQAVAFDSDFIHTPKSENCAACGNLGVMAINESDRTAKFMQQMLRSMGDVLQVRGGQAGGSVLLREINGVIKPDLSRAVNTKRGVLRDKMHAGAARSLKKGKTPAVYTDFRHVRFGTSSAPSETETHPFVFGDHFVSHNGDFDEYLIAGKMRENGEVGVWLHYAVGFPNIENGDSPKAVGLLNYLITKGKLFESVRYGYHETHNSEEDYERVISGQGISVQQLNKMTAEFQAVVSAWETTGQETRESLVSALTQNLPQYSQEMILTTVNAYFDNDLYQAVKIFSANSEGTFGFIAGSAEYPNKIVMYGDSQPLSLGFDPAKKMVVWTSEPAVLKVPLPDGSRIPYRIDLLQDVGEVFEITLQGNGVPQLRVYDQRAGKELSHEEMQKSFRLIDMLKSKYISSLPSLDYQNQDLVALDLKDMAGVLDRLREDWLKADSTNRQTAGALVQILVEKYIGKMIKDHATFELFGDVSQYATEQASLLAREFMSNEINEIELMTRVHSISDKAREMHLQMLHDPKIKAQINTGDASIEDPVDILITGMLTNLWAAEPFAARLSEMFPRLRIATTSSNKILRALKSTGLQTPIRKITVKENSRLITISRNTVVIVADGDMGQDFAPLNAAIALRKLIGDRLFMITPEYDTKLGALVQNFHEKAPFEKRVFRTFVGNDSAWRPAEATTVSQQAMDQTFTEILLRLGQDMRNLFKNSDPFRMSVSDADFDQLRRHNREHTHAKMPDITGHNLDGSDRSDSTVYKRIMRPFHRWSQHISDGVYGWYFSKLFVYAVGLSTTTVTALIFWSVGLGIEWSFGGALTVALLIRFVNSTIANASKYIFVYFRRLFQGREPMHGQGTRSVVIADVPKINQTIKEYVKRLKAQSTFLTSFFVDSSNGSDHGPYKDPSTAGRVLLLIVGFTEAKLVGLGHAFKSAKLYASQAQGIQSIPFQDFWEKVWRIPVLGSIAKALGFRLVPPEIVTIGQHAKLERNSAKENVFLGERVEEISASSDRLVKALVRIRPLQNRVRDVETVVAARIGSLNDFAKGEFNKDVATLSVLISTDLNLPQDPQIKKEVEIAVEAYMRRHVFLTGFIEERFFQNQRMAAMQVGFHQMVSRYSYSKNKLIFKIKQKLGIGHRHWETQSHLRVATTASPESGADVTAVAQRMMASATPQTKSMISSHPDVLPFEVVQSAITSAAKPEQKDAEVDHHAERLKIAAEMKAYAESAKQRLTAVQKEVVESHFQGLLDLAGVIQETTNPFKKPVLQAVFRAYVKSGDWIGKNGMSPPDAAAFGTTVSRIEEQAQIPHGFDPNGEFDRLVRSAGVDQLRLSHPNNPVAVAQQVLSIVMQRSEFRVVNDRKLTRGLQASTRMKSEMFVDAELVKARQMLLMPRQKVQQAASAALDSEASDSGLVVLERPYSADWISLFLKKLPAGAKVVLRTPEPLSPAQLNRYTVELGNAMRRKIFSIEVSPAQSETWIEQKLGSNFEPSSVIQIEAPQDPTAADDEMLLLTAPMAAGHVLILGQPKRLGIRGMQFFQIRQWINQLYDAVMAVEQSA